MGSAHFEQSGKVYYILPKSIDKLEHLYSSKLK